MRRFIKYSDVHIGYNFEGLSFQNVVVREVTPVDEFYFESTISSDDNQKCIGFTDPIKMLFNQERLSKIGSTAINGWLDSLKKSSKDPLAELRSKCSDEELKAVIKSRLIQQPSELMAYVEECKKNMESFTSALKEYQKAQLQEQQAQMQQQQSVNPSPLVDSTNNVETKPS